ncbi:hypothetical protein D3C77_782870 [compost metagenome]
MAIWGRKVVPRPAPTICTRVCRLVAANGLILLLSRSRQALTACSVRQCSRSSRKML